MASTESRIRKAETWVVESVSPKALFDSPDLKLLCAKDIEGQYYERKSKRDPARLAETICAFANSNREHGGLLAVGISDQGAIAGLRNREDVNVKRLLEYHYHTGTPTKHKFVDCVNEQGERDQILLVYVPYLEGRVAETSKGRAYVRRSHETIELRDPEKRELEYSKGQISFEDEIACEYSDDIIVKEILDELRRSVISADHAAADISETQLLLSKHLVKKKGDKLHLTKAGILLLGKDPKAILPGAYVRFIRYDGTEKKPGRTHNVVKDETFSDPIPRLIQRLRDFIRSQLRDFTFMGPDGTFVQEPEYPEDVWQEAVVNALVHRSYSLTNMPILIEMYDDRLEVQSPGDYPAGVHPREFIHNPRNPHLMEAMRYLRFVRMLSEGSLRMRQGMKHSNLPAPEFSEPGNPYVRVILRNDIERRIRKEKRGAETVSQFANLYRITWKTAPAGEAPTVERARPPEVGELREAVLKGLEAQGYAIDSFFKQTAIDVNNRFTIDELDRSGLASIYPGFRFRVIQLKSGIYLLLDFSVHVKNLARLDKLLRIYPGLKTRDLYRGFVREGKKWVPCRIEDVDAERGVSVRLWGDEDHKITAAASDVLPVMPTTSIMEILQRAGIDIDLHKTIKRLSLSLSRNAARERKARTSEIAKSLSQTVFPLRVRDYKIYLSPEPERLKGTGIELRSDLSDPEPVFSKETEGRAKKVLNGLSTYGSYDKPRCELPLVVLCTSDTVDKMKSLVDALRKGSAKYRGLEKTFAISLGEPIVEAVNSPEDYLDKCRQICASVPKGSFFLVYCPESGYSRADYEAPYYKVKHFLLEAGFPSQMVSEETLADPSMKDYNLALDIFAKAGYVPWVLSAGLSEADLFLGLSYSSVGGGEKPTRLIGYVNVFDRYGRWLYYKGNTTPISFEGRNQAFRKLLADVVKEYQKKAKLQRLHVQHGFKLSHEGRHEIARGVEEQAPQAEVSFVYVNRHSPLRLYDDSPQGDGTLARGSYVVVSPNRFFIATTGQNELGQKGLGTPRPLEVIVNRIRSKGELDIRVYAQHILSLTRLNWASTKDFCREPITLKYASDIAYLMNVFLASFGEFKLHPRLERTPWFL